MRGASAEQVDRGTECEREAGQYTQLEEEVRKLPAARRSLVGLGGHHHDAPHHGDHPDEEEGFGEDLPFVDDEPERVQELGDDEQEQDAIQHQQPALDRVAASAEVVDERVDSAGNDENTSGDEEQPDRDVQPFLTQPMTRMTTSGRGGAWIRGRDG